MNKNSMDTLFEELLSESASLATKEMSKSVTDTDIEEDFSSEHKVKMKKLFKRERRKQYIRKIGTYTARVASVLVIVIVVSGLAIFKVDALRVRFMNMFTNTEETNTNVKFNENPTYTVGDIVIGYIPEGFELIKKKYNVDMVFLKFKNGNEYFDVDIRKSHNKLSLDTEDSDVENVNLNGREVLYAQKESTNILTGYIEENTLFLVGNVDRNILYKIYQYVKINK